VGVAAAAEIMEQLMAGDAGGRRAHLIALEQTVNSPMHTVTSSAGTQPFEEQLKRHPAENHSTEDKRQERKDHGYVHFSKEPHVPDVGGIGWRTRTGHMLKNQAYYSSAPKTNKWDLPIHAGINTWKDWHGPKLRTDANMMERLDHFDEEDDQWQAKKCYVNTVRAQTLDRFYNKKLNQKHLATSQSWAPHRRAGREVNDCHDHFFGDLDSKPEKQLKKVLTPMVLQRDRDAVRAITSRIQNEETWKLAWKHMEQERRLDIRHDFRQRQSYNDLLMHLSGQPVRQRDPADSQEPRFNSCSQRTEALCMSRETPEIQDVTSQTDFRGLFHADNEHALEALFPGSGHEMSVEFRQRATDSTKAGWPAPEAASTPRLKSKNREKMMQKDCSLSTASVPVSRPRLDSVATRHHDETLKDYSKAQFLSTVAPPPPMQKKQLLREDFSPKTMLQDPARVTGTFQRIDQGTMPHAPYHPSSPKNVRKAVEGLPPGQRAFTYPVLAATPSNQRSQAADEWGSPASSMYASASAPTMLRPSNSPANPVRRRCTPSTGEESSTAVCRELDEFEASITSLPRVSNFFGTPRSHRRVAQERQISKPLSHSASAPVVKQTS
jgi:hypothetical protein